MADSDGKLSAVPEVGTRSPAMAEIRELPLHPQFFQRAQIQNAAQALAEIDPALLADDVRRPLERAIAALAADPMTSAIPADLGQRAQRAAEEHLEACLEAYYAAEEEEDPENWPESPACAPFCDCMTCTVREVLFAAWPVLEQAARNGELDDE